MAMVSAPAVAPVAAPGPLAPVSDAANAWKKHFGDEFPNVPPSVRAHLDMSRQLDLSRLPPSPTRARCRRAQAPTPTPKPEAAQSPTEAGTVATSESPPCLQEAAQGPPLPKPKKACADVSDQNGCLGPLGKFFQMIPGLACDSDRKLRTSPTARMPYMLREQTAKLWTEETADHVSELASGLVNGLQTSSSRTWLVEECRVRRTEAMDGILQVQHLLFEAEWEALEEADGWTTETIESAMACYEGRLEWAIGMIFGLQKGLRELRRLEAGKSEFEGDYAVMMTLLNECEEQVENLAQDFNIVRGRSYE